MTTSTRASSEARRAFVRALPVNAYWLLEFDHYKSGRAHALRHRMPAMQDRCVVGHDGSAHADRPEPIEQIVYTDGWAHEVDPTVFLGIDMLLIHGQPEAARELALRNIIRTMAWAP